ncbi:hypothetical protein [Planomonospora venezuelensis]|uniref:Uncharacterized small protein (DUF1192 family) n=1 Tax=Planomonospora venezuelensis TaxID=1999 RepID=A0A841D6C9_PLAVE|nr:hypothetical protein [Planomonospora venezuelensis]MBB5963006.1 uncharacterized small protein (DUF1192 family) [Planomonospora venezuelensis]GIN00574.1 hypothetical protein Pve01_22320 [Planomonospora venezuelensis]
MVRLAKRALIPAGLRRLVRGWFDARYISRADHRQDIRDALWEVRTLSREVTALRAEVERLRAQGAGSGGAAGVRAEAAQVRRWDDAHRLATESAAAMDRLLQNEVLLWQAVDRLSGDGGGDAGAAAAGDRALPSGSVA